jgi:hypothetical protein
MRFDVVILRMDGTWECIEDVVHFELLDDGSVELIQEDNTVHGLDNIAQITLQRK